MPIFYKGAGPGTWWNSRNACKTGFTVARPGTMPTVNQLLQHIVHGSPPSPYLSLTRSYGVAWDYAMHFGDETILATAKTPGYVYVIELDDPLPPGLQLLDPIAEVAKHVPGPLQANTYHHDGLPQFLLEVVRPQTTGLSLSALHKAPPPGGGLVRGPNLSLELEALVRALRDAEILAVGNIPAACVRQRLKTY